MRYIIYFRVPDLWITPSLHVMSRVGDAQTSVLRATENVFGIAACRQTDSPGEHGSGAESAVYAACVVL